MNLLQCPSCKLDVMMEEMSTHRCRKVIDYRIEDNILLVFDGNTWYPLKLKPIKIQQPQGNINKNAEDETEPEIRFCKVIGSFPNSKHLSKIGTSFFILIWSKPFNQSSIFFITNKITSLAN